MRVLFSLSGLALVALVRPASAQESTPPAPAQTPANKVEGVVVTTPSQTGVQTRIDRRSYSLSGDLQAANSSIGDALSNLPSVDVDPQGNLSLRGDANVTILVDGKPSGLFKGPGRAAALQQLPAGQYARVEILTTPSAAFDANGSGGVINLISKKARGAGWTGSLQAKAGDGGVANGGVTLGYNAGKLSLNADLNARRDTRKIKITDRRDLASGVQSVNVRQAHPISYTSNAQLSADYEANDRTTLSAKVHHTQLDFSSRSTDVYQVRSPAGDTETVRGGRRTTRVYDDEVETQLIRKFAGEDHDLTLNLDHEETINKDHQPYTYRAGAPPTGAYEAYDFDQHQTLTRFAADYRKPLPRDAKLAVGIQVEDDGYLYEDGGVRGADGATALPDPSLTNRFHYDQVVSALYATLERPFGRLTAQMGLRFENAQIRTEQLTLGQVHRSDDTRVFPSLHLDYALDDHRQLKAAFTQRIRRPDPDSLNPFPNRSGALIVTAGNPFLKPEETRGFEASYEYRDGPTYHLATVFFRDIRDTVTDIVTALDDGVLLSTKTNLGRRRNTGIELSAGGRLTSKLSYTVSATATYSEIDPQSLASKDRAALLIGGKSSLNFQLTPADLVQLNTQVFAKRLTPQGYAPAYGMLNLGYRRKIDERLWLVATVRDVLNTTRIRSFVHQPGLNQRFEYENNSRRFTIGLTYAFGGKAKKPASFDYGS
jgi:outer membrane receptor protein involved in Fe transport